MALNAETLTILFPSLVKANNALANAYFFPEVNLTNCDIISTQAFLTPQTFSKHF